MSRHIRRTRITSQTKIPWESVLEKGALVLGNKKASSRYGVTNDKTLSEVLVVRKNIIVSPILTICKEFDFLGIVTYDMFDKERYGVEPDLFYIPSILQLKKIMREWIICGTIKDKRTHKFCKRLGWKDNHEQENKK